MSHASQRHRQEFYGLDSSGRPPAPGNHLAQAQGANIENPTSTPAAAVATGPAAISIVGQWAGTESVEVQFTDDNTGAQTTTAVAAPAGGPAGVVAAVAAALDGLVDTVVNVVGNQIQLSPALPATTLTVTAVIIA